MQNYNKCQSRFPALLRCVCYAYLHPKNLVTQISCLSKRDQFELTNCSLVDQPKLMTLRLDNTSDSKVRAYKYILKLATSVDININTFKPADLALLDFAIEHFKSKLSKKLFINFTNIINTDKILLKTMIHEKHLSMFSSKGW